MYVVLSQIWKRVFHSKTINKTLRVEMQLAVTSLKLSGTRHSKDVLQKLRNEESPIVCQMPIRMFPLTKYENSKEML